MTDPTMVSKSIERHEVGFYLVYIFSLGLLFCSDLAYRPVWTDEALTYYQVSSRSFPGLLDSFNAGVNAIPYFYFLPLWGLDQLFGLSPASLRFPSLIFAIVAIIVLHRILKTRFGNGIAFVSCASALLMTSEFVLYSHEARPYSLYALGAVFSLYSGIALLREKTASNAVLLVNGLAAFVLPAVHYVGIFYSFGVSVAVLFAGRVRGRSYFLKVASSFCVGWALFFWLHLSQILLFARNGGAIDPSWIPKPALSNVLNTAMHYFSFPPAISVLVVTLVGFRLFKAAPDHLRANMYLGQSSTDTFLFLVSLIWLAIPPSFYFFGSIGLPNLSLPRYFLPSQLAVAVIGALLLEPYIHRYELGRWGTMRFANIHAINVGILGLLLYLIIRAGIAAREMQGAIRWEYQGKNNFTYVTDSELPCVTNNVHQFFTYSFYSDGRQVLYFLKKTPNEVSKFKKLDNRLPILSLDELTQLSAFRFVYQKGGSVNSFPEFDIHVWGEIYGYVIKKIGKRDNVDLYTARKM